MTVLPLTTNFPLFDADGITGLGFLLILAILGVLAIIGVLISKLFKKDKATEPASAPVAEKSETVTTEEAVTETEVEEEVAEEKESELPYTPGYVTLDGVAEQDAAVIMAITSFRTDIPLERLAFRSIRRLNQDPVLENVSEQDAAVIMAITSNKTGIPLEKLAFNSIKLVEE